MKGVALRNERTWQFIMLVVGVLLSGYLGYFIGNIPEEISFLEYEKINRTDPYSGLFKKENLKISFQGKKLKSWSSADFSLANTTKKNLGKVKVLFEIKSKQPEFLFYEANAPRTYPTNTIKLISSKNGTYIFEIEYMNRMEAFNYPKGFRFVFNFNGNTLPEITIKTGIQGVNIKKAEYISNYSILDTLSDFRIILALLFAAITGFLSLKFIGSTHK